MARCSSAAFSVVFSLSFSLVRPSVADLTDFGDQRPNIVKRTILNSHVLCFYLSFSLSRARVVKIKRRQISSELRNRLNGIAIRRTRGGIDYASAGLTISHFAIRTRTEWFFGFFYDKRGKKEIARFRKFLSREAYDSLLSLSLSLCARA